MGLSGAASKIAMFNLAPPHSLGILTYEYVCVDAVLLFGIVKLSVLIHLIYLSRDLINSQKGK